MAAGRYESIVRDTATAIGAAFGGALNEALACNPYRVTTAPPPEIAKANAERESREAFAEAMAILGQYNRG
jgi:hypothetical protein